MQKIIYLKNFNSNKKGDVEIVSNNIAHGLIESGIVRIYGGVKVGMFKAPADKMMRPETKVERRVKQKPETRVEKRVRQRYPVKENNFNQEDK